MNVTSPAPAAPSLLDWGHDKVAIQNWSGLSDDTLHLMTGMLILTVAAFVWRRAPWHWLPWATVMLAETLNEIHDLISASDPADEGNWADSWHDFWLTLLWPTVILLLYRRWAKRDNSGD